MENTEGPTPARRAADAFQSTNQPSVRKAQELLEQAREQHEWNPTPATAANVADFEARLAAIIERTEG